MSTKHYFPETAVNTLVPRALRALVRTNPSLSLIEAEKVVYNINHGLSQVAIIGGGGSGHEPAWSGYVGDGLLAASACGDIFASPSMKQVLTAIAAVPSDKGAILLITNYTGDKLHFGLAAERALAGGLCEKAIVLPTTDDVSIGKSKSKKVGRRGLAGNVITMKILGAAAARKYSFERCVEMGKAVNSQLASIGSTLDHCHVPGRQNHDAIPDNVCVFGAGMHNEPGAERVSPFPSFDDVISRLLKLLCDQQDPERSYVKFEADDDIVLLINNYGGLSNLELGALTDEAINQLDVDWHIRLVKIYSGSFETSLNGPGFSITLCNLSKAAEGCKSSTHELLDLLSAETSAPSWPNILSNTSPTVKQKLHPVIDLKKPDQSLASYDIKVDPRLLETMIRKGCERAIQAEPYLTKWDMIMGDGDCGEAVKGVCEAVLEKLSQNIATGGAIFTVLNAITDCIDAMGGTLGAIFGILLAAFTTSLRSLQSNWLSSCSPLPIDIYSCALSLAVSSLKNYTGARVGDRTVMDVLIPFAETLEKERDFKAAVDAARVAAEGTRMLKPSFGRASYVGEGANQELPDPGAWALMEIVTGMYDGLSVCAQYVNIPHMNGDLNKTG